MSPLFVQRVEVLFPNESVLSTFPLRTSLTCSVVNIALQPDWEFSDMVDAIDTNVRGLTVATFTMWEAFQSLEREVSWLRNDLHANMNLLLSMAKKLDLNITTPVGFSPARSPASVQGDPAQLTLGPDDPPFVFSPIIMPPYLGQESPSPSQHSRQEDPDIGATSQLVRDVSQDGDNSGQDGTQGQPWPPPPSQMPQRTSMLSRGRLFMPTAYTESNPQPLASTSAAALDPQSSSTVRTLDAPQLPRPSPVHQSDEGEGSS